MFDSQLSQSHLHGRKSQLLQDLEIIHHLADTNDFSPDFKFNRFMEQLVGGKEFFNTEEVKGWFNSCLFPSVQKRIFNFLFNPARHFLSLKEFNLEQLQIAEDYFSFIETAVSHIESFPKRLFSKLPYETYQAAYNELTQLLDGLTEALSQQHQRILSLAEDNKRKIREWDDANDIHADVHGRNVEAEEEEAFARKREKFISKLDSSMTVKVGTGEKQIDLSPIQKIIDCLNTMLDFDSPVEVKVDITHCLLESLWFVNNRMYDLLELDRGADQHWLSEPSQLHAETSTNVFQAMELGLEKAPFLQYVIEKNNEVVSLGSSYPNETEILETMLGVAVPKFQLGYTPANLRKILEITKLTQIKVAEIIQKSRYIVARYTLEKEDEKHVSMSHSDWEMLLAYVQKHYQL